MAAAGLAAPEPVISDAWDVFDAEAAEPVLAAIATGLSASAINDAFNFPREQLDAMVAAGFIKPIPSSDETYAAYAPADIHAFFERLLVGSVPMRQTGSADLTSMLATVERLIEGSNRPFHDIYLHEHADKIECRIDPADLSWITILWKGEWHAVKVLARADEDRTPRPRKRSRPKDEDL